MKDLCQYGNRPKDEWEILPWIPDPRPPFKIWVKPERLARGVIQEFEENNSGVDLFHFDSDEDVFCVYSQYIDDLMLLSKMIRAACDNEKTMRTYLGKGEVEHEK